MLKSIRAIHAAALAAALITANASAQSLPGPAQGGWYVIMANAQLGPDILGYPRVYCGAVVVPSERKDQEYLIIEQPSPIFMSTKEMCSKDVTGMGKDLEKTCELFHAGLLPISAKVKKRFGPYESIWSATSALQRAGWQNYEGNIWGSNSGCF